MRILILIGILLAGLGAWIVFRGLSYSSSHSEVKVGTFEATIKEKRDVPTWVGGVAIVGGLVLIAAGAGAARRN